MWRREVTQLRHVRPRPEPLICGSRTAHTVAKMWVADKRSCRPEIDREREVEMWP